jgi:hypothetical protein
MVLIDFNGKRCFDTLDLESDSLAFANVAQRGFRETDCQVLSQRFELITNVGVIAVRLPLVFEELKSLLEDWKRSYCGGVRNLAKRIGSVFPPSCDCPSLRHGRLSNASISSRVSGTSQQLCACPSR